MSTNIQMNNFDFPDEFFFQNATTPEDFIKRNSVEFLKWSVRKIVTEPDSKMACTLARELIKRMVPKPGQGQGRDMINIEALRTMDDRTLQDIAEGKIGADELQLVDGVYMVTTDRPETLTAADPIISAAADQANSKPAVVRSVFDVPNLGKI